MDSAREALADTKDAVTGAADRLERVLEHEGDEYAHGARRPLREYALLMGAYLGGSAALAVLARRRGQPLPDRISAADLALLGIATHRVSRLLSRDSITSVVRAPFRRYVEPGEAGEVNEETRGTGVRHAVGELIGCPFCIGQWVGTGFVAGMVFAPRATRLVASVFTIVALSDTLQFGYAALQRTEH
jgi:uncharacterized protein DUF1360